MKLIGIVGSNADSSYNRLLLQYIGKEFYKMFDLEILEIKDIPMFNQSKDQTNRCIDSEYESQNFYKQTA